MNTKLIAALACGAALALGACSGGAPATSTTTPTTPDPTDPADPGTDDRTAAERAFDTALTSAVAALATARTAVTDAVALANAADTAAKRTAATAALNTARTGLTTAVNRIRGLTATAPTGDTVRRGRAEAAARDAGTALTADTAKLTSGEAAIQTAANAGSWYGGAELPPSYRVPTTAFKVTRRARNTGASPDANHDKLLTSTTFPAVQYATGDFFISAGKGTCETTTTRTCWFPMRGHEVSKKRASGALHHYDIHSDHQDTDLGAPNPTSVLIAGMKITSTGLMMQLGGKSTADLDFVRDITNLRTATAAGAQRLTSAIDDEGWDLTLEFGTPGTSPDGNGEFYWTAPLYKDATQSSQNWSDDTGGGNRDSGNSNLLGRYSIWLTNFYYADYGREPTEGGGRYTDDDEFSFLKYAAYGMMTLAPARNLRPIVSGRIHAFHVGYDAFKDEAGKQADDIGANKFTNGKFVGRTIGFTAPTQLVAGATNYPNLVDVEGARRLRGDVELTVTISDTSQRVTDGSIKNLEYWNGTSRTWSKLTSVPSRIDVEADDIDPDGTFSPLIRVRNAADTGNDAAYERQGELYGAFYGPQNELEVAGWWAVATGGPPTPTTESLIGSFGAKHQPAPAAGN